MGYRKSVYLLILAFLSINIFSESNNRFLGYWLTSASIVHVKDCEQSLCATIEHIFVDEGVDPKSILEENFMRRSPISNAVAEEEDINLTPMLDVVFILLIFFIVTANFIKEPGLEVNRPDAETSNIQENAAILIAIGATNDIWIDGRRVDVRGQF